jgi:hypothetical protein
MSLTPEENVSYLLEQAVVYAHERDIPDERIKILLVEILQVSNEADHSE